MVNEAWRIGDAVLRIVRQDMNAECDTEAPREVAIVPLLRKAGIKTPALLAAGGSAFGDDSGCRPYTIYEFVEDDLLGFLKDPPTSFGLAYRQLGAELAKVHRVAVPDSIKALFRSDRSYDPGVGIGKAVEVGKIDKREADEIAAWVDQLAPFMKASVAQVLVHNDVHPWNLMVDAVERRLSIDDRGPSQSLQTPSSKLQSAVGLAAILDWGDASLGDPSVDFAGMPLQAIPPMLEGYSEAGGAIDDGLVGRSLYHGLRTWLWEIVNLDLAAFDRHWWRMPPGGWDEMKSLVADLFPPLVPL